MFQDPTFPNWKSTLGVPRHLQMLHDSFSCVAASTRRWLHASLHQFSDVTGRPQVGAVTPLHNDQGGAAGLVIINSIFPPSDCRRNSRHLRHFTLTSPNLCAKEAFKNYKDLGMDPISVIYLALSVV